MAESEAAAPVSGEIKKKRGGIGAVLDRKDEEIAHLKAELEKERAERASPVNVFTTGSTEPTTVIEAAITPSAPPSPAPEGYDITRDPLGWITDETDTVYLIGRVSHILMWRGYDDKLGKQDKKYLMFNRDVQWVSNPFKPRTFRSRAEEDNYAADNFQWHLFEIHQEKAVEAYAGRDPIPKRAIVYVEDYEGLDMSGRPKGKRTPCSDVPMREFVRHALITNPSNLWLWTDWHEYRKGCLNLNRPNPYGKGIEDTSNVPVRQGFIKD